jgi:hypothetical protein
MEDKDIQIFIVFHKNIFDECYKHIPDDILYKYFTFYAVNKNIEKHYTQNKYKIVNEWELSIYDKTLQERGYNENSAIYHVYANNLHKDYKYIGFFQYDMMFNNNIIEFLQKNITQTPTLFSLPCFNFNFCSYHTWNEPNTLNYVINDYENFYKKSFCKNYNYPLCNSYIIPNETYEKTMKWVVQLYDKMYPWCIEYPNKSHFGHIGGIYERIMGYCIGEENLKNIELDVSHDHKYKALSY